MSLLKWSAFVLLQGTSAAFFLGDICAEIAAEGWGPHTLLESMAIFALVLGAGLGAAEAYRVSRSAGRANEDLKRAQGAFSERARRRFAAWALTPAERDVALLLLKGFDIQEIAGLRQTAEGTVRAQLSRIYEKSGQPNRGRFVSSFLDMLIPDSCENRQQ